MARLAELEADKNAAVSAEHYEEASRIRDEISEVQAKLDGGRSRRFDRLRRCARPRRPRVAP